VLVEGARGVIGGRLLTLREVADELRCSVPTVKRRIRSGALPSYRDGHIVCVREDDLRRYVAERLCRRSPAPDRAAAGRALRKGEHLWD
jgi:excisionase family DNA binding protein